MALIKNNLLLFATALLVSVGLFSCVKNKFDEPPVGDCSVNVTSNISIKDLKAKRLSIGVPDAITDDLIIKGAVISDDRLGNFYKTLVIQDATAGIEIKIDNAFLYQSYPVGREIYVRCKGLLLTDYNGVIQLAGSAVQQGSQLDVLGLTEAQERLNLVRGCSNVPVTPRVVTMADMNSNTTSRELISTLITVNNAQFTQCDAARPWADVTTQSSLNRELENCSGEKVLVRSSGYADFAGQLTPTGNGSLTAVFSVYNSDKQLYIRDLNDVAGMTGTRCSTNSGTGTETEMKISDLRAVFTGSTTSAPAGRKIHGHVISDRVSNNLNNKNVYIQERDGSAGIVVRFTAAHCFEVGDEVEVVVSGQELSQFNSLMQVNNVPLSNAVLVSRGNVPVVRTATIAQVNANFDAWESTLVKLSGVTISGTTAIYALSKTLTDASGSIVMFTQASASFANYPIPTAPVSVTAIVSDFNGKQVILRNLTDVQ